MQGIERTFHYTDQTVVKGLRDLKQDSREAIQGLTKGADVAVHYTKQNTGEVATEVDRLGTDGLKSVEGTIAQINRDAKTLTIRTASGVDQTFRLSERAVSDTGIDLDKDVDKSVKVTVYYLELAGQNTAQLG